MRAAILTGVLMTILVSLLFAAVLLPVFDATLPIVPESSPVNAEVWAKNALSTRKVMVSGLLVVTVGALGRMRGM